VKNFPYGLGEALGDPLVTGATFRTSALVFYVHHTGSDTYSGQDRVKPKATLQAAVTEALTGDLIVMLPNHAENVATSITLNYQIAIVGAGAGSTMPTLTWTGTTSGPLLDVNNDGILLGSIKFAASTVLTAATVQVYIGGLTGVTIRGCVFQLAAGDISAVLVAGHASAVTVEDTTFTSTATVVTAQPVTAVLFENDGSELGSHGWVMDTVTFDGGTAGFSQFSAYDDTLSDSKYSLFENITLANGADMKLASTSTGILNVDASEEGGMVDW